MIFIWFFLLFLLKLDRGYSSWWLRRHSPPFCSVICNVFGMLNHLLFILSLTICLHDLTLIKLSLEGMIIPFAKQVVTELCSWILKHGFMFLQHDPFKIFYICLRLMVSSRPFFVLSFTLSVHRFIFKMMLYHIDSCSHSLKLYNWLYL